MERPPVIRRTALLAISVILFTALTITGCGRKGMTQRIVITGSSTIAPLMMEIAARFEKSHPEYRIDVQTGGSSRGIKDASDGLSDIGMASRELKSSESTELKIHRIAVDGIGILVHKDNPVTQLTSEELVKIYLGQINNWSQLGGPDQEIAVINKASGRGTLEVFLKHFAINEADIQADIVVGENQQAMLTIGGNPAAIGYVSIGAADAEIKRGAELKLISLDGIEASVQTVANGSFPVARNLNLVTQASMSDSVRQFVEFATSQQVSDLVESQFFVPLSN